MYRRRRRRRGPPWWRIGFLLALLAAAIVWAGTSFLSPKGRYWTAQNFWRGAPSRVRPVVEEALAKAARDLSLPEPAPVLLCAPDPAGKTVCRASVRLEPEVSTLQANAAFTRRLTDLGLLPLHGTEAADGRVTVAWQAGRRTSIEMELVPAAPTALDTAIAPGPGLPQVPVKVRLALIIDDYGENEPVLAELERLPARFTAGIHPEKPGAAALAERARRSGMEAILNLPMEPKGFPTQDPGPNSVLVDMPGRAIRSLVRRHVERIAPVVGAKSWMGSLAVEDRDVMRALLEELKARDLLFVDDTQQEFSTTVEIGREVNLPVLRLTSRSEIDRRVRGDAYTVGVRFDDFVDACRGTGYGIAVIHLKDPTLAVLKDRLPRLAREGIVVMGVGEVARVQALE